MTKRRKTKKQQQQEIKNFIYALIIVILSVISIFSYGWIGTQINGAFRLTLGRYPEVFFTLLIIYAFMLVFQNKKLKKMPKRIWFGIILALMVFVTTLAFPKDVNLVGMNVFKTFHKGYKEIFLNPKVDAFGGYFGAGFYSLSSYLFAREGTILVNIALSLLSLVLIFTPSKIMKFFQKIGQGIKKIFGHLGKLGNKMKPAKDDEEEIDEEEVTEDEWFDKPTRNNGSANFMQVDGEETPRKSGVFMDVDDESVNSQKLEPVLDQNDQMKFDLTEQKQTINPLVTVNNDSNFENYQLPPLTLLEGVKRGGKSSSNKNSADKKGEQVIKVLKQFGIEAELLDTHIGPSVTKFEIKPDSNVKLNRISAIQDNIMMELAVTSLRIEAPIPGRAAVGIEIPNIEMSPVRLRETITNTNNFFDKENIWVALGKNLMGESVSIALNKMPHLLIAGATGSGKSVCINSVISSILLSKHPDELKLILIDPKKVEFTPYLKIPHLFCPVVTDPNEASVALQKVVVEMEARYEKFANAGVRNITAYNQKVKDDKEGTLKFMPWIVVIIDELADLMLASGKEVEASIQRITQLARASGIHLIVATQRPSVDVITGVIKANIPSRIAFSVSSAIDSRTILDTPGAEKLLGYGDMLYVPMGEPSPTRVQGVFVSDSEVNAITQYASEQGDPNFSENFTNLKVESSAVGGGQDTVDELYDEVVRFIIDNQKASTSFVQRQFRIGYNRAANIIDDLEERGVVGPANGSKPRTVMYRTYDEYEERLSKEVAPTEEIMNENYEG